MNKKTATLLGAGALLLISFFVGRCSAPTPVDSHAGHSQAVGEAPPEESTTWTCSMHPQIQQSEPGDCPICGMTLIPLEKDDGADDGPRVLSMSESSRALAEIQTSVIERRFPEAEIRLVGKLGYDETKEKSLTARFPARIDALYVNFTGVPVKQGDLLAIVYSPDLLTAQSELLSAYRYDPNNSATQAAREKLRLWDLLPDQIDAIVQSGEAKDRFELKAPISGIVVHRNVKEGDYIKTGQSLFKIVDLNALWLRLDAYESDLSWLHFGQSVSFGVEAYPGQAFEGKIAFIDPELNRKTRTVSIRVNVPNADGKLKPGMFAKAIVRSRIAQAGNVYAPEFAGKWVSPMHPEIVKDAPGQCDVCGMDLVPAEELGYVQNADAEMPLVIPASAVLRTGKRAVVYVEKPNTKRPTYEGREIEIGPRAGSVFIVVSGVKEGERVVTNGAFKIDSSLQIKAKPSMMNPKGGGPAPGHNHGGASPSQGHGQDSAPAVLALEVAVAKQALSHYYALQSALAGDDLARAKSALKELMGVTGHTGPIGELIHTMLASKTLDALRRPHFEALSNAFIEVVSSNKAAFEGDVFKMRCPMVYPDRGANWIQAKDETLNPYFGASMLTCGSVQENLTKKDMEGEDHEH